MARQKRRLPRVDCPWCGKNVAALSPKDGDGSAYKPRAHNLPTTGNRCRGSYEAVDAAALTDEGWVCPAAW